MKSLDPLEGIATFLAVSEQLNFSQAAEAIGVSRATVSAQLKALEQRLGTRLFHRTTRSVRLTEAGTAYRDALSGVLPQIRQAEHAAASFQHEAVGRLRISAPPELGPNHLAPAIGEFMTANPGLTIELDLSHQAVNLVEAGFDLALRGTISVEPNLIARKVGAATVMACASPRYLKRQGWPGHPEQLSQHACLHFSELRWGRVWHFSRDRAVCRVPIVPRLEINDGQCLRRAALEGAGITMLPSFVVGEDIREGRLVQLFPEWAIATIPIQAVYPANRHIANKVRSFVGFLAKRLAQLPDLAGR